jgi:hypothetical protein
MSDLDRREFLAGVAAAAAARARPAHAGPLVDEAARRAPATEGLAEPTFRPLPLGAIRPKGWLERQLRLQVAGLTGHLDEFWPDVAESRWFGGRAEGWERAPYWLDGAIPLAWILGDTPLQDRITRHVSYVVEHQRADGWYGPYPLDAAAKPYDLWAILLANKALTQYHEATGDARVLEAVRRSLRALLEGLDRTPLFGWGRFRWFEGLVSAFYVYERTREPWLLDLARKLREQGVDFEALYRTEDVTVPTPRRGLWKWTKHVVNTAMATKSAALSWRLGGRPGDGASAARMLEILDRYHGQVTGVFSGDECLAGRNPLQGTELCAVVELLYSLETLFSVFGDTTFADRLERVAWNALPATLAPDMWSHQYDQQVNQAQCTINPEHLFTTNGPESNLFGLAPNYGCCTANMHQGWPKLAAHLWMKTADEGLVAAAWAPSEVAFRSRDVPVAVRLDTEYPFRETLSIRVRVERAARFPLVLRVPAWTEGATVRVGAGAERPMRAGSLHRVEREWQGETTIAVRFPMRPRVSVRYNEAVAVERGPIVYSLAIGEEWTRVNADEPHRELPHGDFEVRPTTPWNYGLVLDPARPEASLRFEERPVGERPFSPEGAGACAYAKARRLPGWRLVNGWAGEISRADPAWAHAAPREPAGPLEEVRLIPYGCTNIRITEFPRLEEQGARD